MPRKPKKTTPTKRKKTAIPMPTEKEIIAMLDKESASTTSFLPPQTIVYHQLATKYPKAAKKDYGRALHQAVRDAIWHRAGWKTPKGNPKKGQHKRPTIDEIVKKLEDNNGLFEPTMYHFAGKYPKWFKWTDKKTEDPLQLLYKAFYVWKEKHEKKSPQKPAKKSNPEKTATRSEIRRKLAKLSENIWHKYGIFWRLHLISDRVKKKYKPLYILIGGKEWLKQKVAKKDTETTFDQIVDLGLSYGLPVYAIAGEPTPARATYGEQCFTAAFLKKRGFKKRPGKRRVGSTAGLYYKGEPIEE